jgi:hypothetical protein
MEIKCRCGANLPEINEQQYCKCGQINYLHHPPTTDQWTIRRLYYRASEPRANFLTVVNHWIQHFGADQIYYRDSLGVFCQLDISIWTKIFSQLLRFTSSNGNLFRSDSQDPSVWRFISSCKTLLQRFGTWWITEVKRPPKINISYELPVKTPILPWQSVDLYTTRKTNPKERYGILTKLPKTIKLVQISKTRGRDKIDRKKLVYPEWIETVKVAHF